jgi:hypothetical protein
MSEASRRALQDASAVSAAPLPDWVASRFFRTLIWTLRRPMLAQLVMALFICSSAGPQQLDVHADRHEHGGSGLCCPGCA